METIDQKTQEILRKKWGITGEALQEFKVYRDIQEMLIQAILEERGACAAFVDTKEAYLAGRDYLGDAIRRREGK